MVKSLETDLRIPAFQLHLGNYLLGRIPGVTKQQLDTLFYQGRVLLNEEAVPADTAAAAGDMVRVMKRDSRILPQKLAVEVVFEDAHCLVANKPAGMAVHPGLGTYGGTLLNWLAWHLEHAEPGTSAVAANQPAEAGVLQQAVVHRLDKATSGLLVLAKTKTANQHLQRQFAAGSTERKYIARVWGCPEPKNGSINLPIGRDPEQPNRIRVDTTGHFGKPALTHYQWLEGQDGTSLLALFPQTGRTHQLRIHLHHIGHGIVGDQRYLQPELKTDHVPTRLCLHAASLGFAHPFEGRWCSFESTLPADF